jgi:two-component system, LuxR family, response regulator FixJ
VTSATVHVLDDDPAVLRSIGRLLGSVGYRTQLYDSAFALLDAAPDISGCILLDVRMPDLSGLEVHERLRDSECPVILMTGHGDVEMAVEVLKSGAVDFLEKPFSEERLFAAIAAALQKTNERPVLQVARRAAAKLVKLSAREREVLDALVKGEAHKVIAHRLGISARTVELHRARMLQRLGTRHLADAIKLAVLAELALDPAEKPVEPAP